MFCSCLICLVKVQYSFTKRISSFVYAASGSYISLLFISLHLLVSMFISQILSYVTDKYNYQEILISHMSDIKTLISNILLCRPISIDSFNRFQLSVKIIHLVIHFDHLFLYFNILWLFWTPNIIVNIYIIFRSLFIFCFIFY